MKMILIILWVIAGGFIFAHILTAQNYNALNMANTVSPIIQKMGEELCDYENIQNTEWAKGSALIYKREKNFPPKRSCIDDRPGNFYYIRCYEWTWKGSELWYKPIKDIPLNCYSCIDEKDIDIPYHDKKLQAAELGVEYLVVSHKE